jgi:exodeoxyribonuclease VII large subunit
MAATDSKSVEPERNVYTVSRLNREARVLLERGFGVVWVEGELSNFSQPASGHWYFSLKDRNAQLRCAMFRRENSAIGFTPRDGAKVLARGRIGLYEPRGEFQFIAEYMEEAGLGALRQQFERLKTKLAAEGLFDPQLKRSLPRFPRRIGVITSPTGAAIRDILHILARRFPPATVLIYPTPVQGAAAVPALIDALRVAGLRRECDVLILARGGGSLEDLWAFNDERLARAVRACPLPVVAGIGHEIDFTIADFVADARAPTPSGAAELVVPDRATFLDALARNAERLNACMRRELRSLSAHFENVSLRLKRCHPGIRLQQQAQRLDDLEQRLAHALRSNIRHDRGRVSELYARLVQRSPDRLVRDVRLRHAELAGRLEQAMRDRFSLLKTRTDLDTRLARAAQARVGNAVARFNHAARLRQGMRTRLLQAESRFSAAARTLNAFSPLATIDRGFAVVTRSSDGTLVTDAKSVAIGDEVTARLARGKLKGRVTGKEE